MEVKHCVLTVPGYRLSWAPRSRALPSSGRSWRAGRRSSAVRTAGSAGGSTTDAAMGRRERRWGPWGTPRQAPARTARAIAAGCCPCIHALVHLPALVVTP